MRTRKRRPSGAGAEAKSPVNTGDSRPGGATISAWRCIAPRRSPVRVRLAPFSRSSCKDVGYLGCVQVTFRTAQVAEGAYGAQRLSTTAASEAIVTAGCGSVCGGSEASSVLSSTDVDVSGRPGRNHAPTTRSLFRRGAERCRFGSWTDRRRSQDVGSDVVDRVGCRGRPSPSLRRDNRGVRFPAAVRFRGPSEMRV
jgi:hypothetical protein